MTPATRSEYRNAQEDFGTIDTLYQEHRKNREKKRLFYNVFFLKKAYIFGYKIVSLHRIGYNIRRPSQKFCLT